MSLESENFSEIRQRVIEIASCYGLFQCVECSSAIRNFLISQNVRAKLIKLDLERQDLPWSVIYDLRRSQQIATNGYHEAVSLIIEDQEIVFDNIDHNGVLKKEWLENLTSPTIELGLGNFKIKEEEF